MCTTVDRIFEQHAVKEPLPGLVYGVIHDGELVHSAGLGVVRLGDSQTPDADSVFRIASMTKSFTAATLLQLRDDGQLGLDDPVVTYVPELTGGAADTRVTLRSLLTMTSGLPTDDPWGDRQQSLDQASFDAFLATSPWQSWQPGEAFEYSNLGYALLGRVVEVVTGRAYRDVVGERLLGPLGMTATGFDPAAVPEARRVCGYVWREDAWHEEPPAGYGAFAAMGGAVSSVRDLATWVAGFLADGAQSAAHPVAAASRREMQHTARLISAEVALADDGTPEQRVRGYGFGLFEAHGPEGRTVGHPGGYPGFGSDMRWHPESGLGLVALGSRTYAPMSRVGGEALRAAVTAAAPGTTRRRAPRGARLRQARAAVTRLLDGWDDAVCAEWFSDNVDADDPLEHRRAQLEEVRHRHGRLVDSPESPQWTDTPSTHTWWMDGERGGRVKVDVMLSPHHEPLIQWWQVTSVPEPAPALRAAAAAALDAARSDARWATASLGPVTGGDGTTRATFSVTGGRLDADVVVTTDDDPPRGRLRVLPVPADIR